MRCFRGIETLTAAGLCAEIGGLGRFPRPTMLSEFLGIVPSERTSDLKRRQGSITKAGSPPGRRLLVEAAQQYRKVPAISHTLARRQAGQDPRVIEIAWRAQRRLHQRWAHLHYQRRKPAGVVATGHKILTAAYHVINQGVAYNELGEEFFYRRDTEHTEHTERYRRRLIKQLERLGHQVTLEPLPEAA